MHENLFEVPTPLGFRVLVRRTRWDLITTVKHPIMANREMDVQQTLQYPEQVAEPDRRHGFAVLSQRTDWPMDLRGDQTSR